MNGGNFARTMTFRWMMRYSGDSNLSGLFSVRLGRVKTHFSTIHEQRDGRWSTLLNHRTGTT